MGRKVGKGDGVQRKVKKLGCVCRKVNVLTPYGFTVWECSWGHHRHHHMYDMLSCFVGQKQIIIIKLRLCASQNSNPQTEYHQYINKAFASEMTNRMGSRWDGTRSKKAWIFIIELWILENLYLSHKTIISHMKILEIWIADVLAITFYLFF